MQGTLCILLHTSHSRYELGCRPIRISLSLRINLLLFRTSHSPYEFGCRPIRISLSLQIKLLYVQSPVHIGSGPTGSVSAVRA